MRKVIKKSGFRQDWDFNKVRTAVGKSCERAMITPAPTFWTALENVIEEQMEGWSEIRVDYLHNIVEGALKRLDDRIYSAYANYRNYKKDFVASWEDIYQKSRDTLYIGDKENANFDSSLISTKGSIIRGYLTKELYRRSVLTKGEIQAIEDGFIYIHDLRDLIFGGINCCLFDMARVLKGGFEMSGIQYKEPRSVLAALQVIGDITLAATAQQFGGFTIPEIDKTLVPYVKMSIKRHRSDASAYGITDADRYVKDKVEEELLQGFQSLEMKLNTVPCSRGDFAFTTLSFGCLDDPQDRELQSMVCEAILIVRMNGQGKNKKPVVFPKLVYLHNGPLHEFSDTQRNLFDLAIECSTKAMYPDYLDVTSQGYVADVYNATGKVISPMGCRAYLSDFKDDNGESVFVGRANIGAVSMNLPMIYMRSKERGVRFEEELRVWMQMGRNFLIKRYEQVAHSQCSTNPLAFTQGGLYKGTKQPTDHVGFDIVKSFTASFGVTAINELCVLMHGVTLDEMEGFAPWVLGLMNTIIDEYKTEDGYLYALYGTPAESLCGTQVKQFRAKYGVIEGVSDRDYFTNSFHIHVSADIYPAEKQQMEHKAFHMCNGGHIQYVRLSNPNNKLAVKSIVSRGMQMGFYQGVNFALAICENCGARPDNNDVCHECGSNSISVIDRVCGYLGFSKVNGDTRMNSAKMAEIKDRKSM